MINAGLLIILPDHIQPSKKRENKTVSNITLPLQTEASVGLAGRMVQKDGLASFIGHSITIIMTILNQ